MSRGYFLDEYKVVPPTLASKAGECRKKKVTVFVMELQSDTLVNYIE